MLLSGGFLTRKNQSTKDLIFRENLYNAGASKNLYLKFSSRFPEQIRKLETSVLVIGCVCNFHFYAKKPTKL